MAVLELFSLTPQVEKLSPSEFILEKNLQNLIEKNMEKFFNVRFLKTEFVINGGRMDSIGIDENNCPVIFEYKRSSNENVINQGLFYLDWLMDHKGDFKLIVMEKLGSDIAEKIEWSAPCVICVASDFTKCDLHAVNQMSRNIKLVRYRKYGDDLICFEHLNAPNITISTAETSTALNNSQFKTHEEQLIAAPENLRAIYDEICAYIESLGDDIVQVKLKYWIAYKKVQNVACIDINTKRVAIYLRLNPESVQLEDGFSENVKNTGHWGTGDLKLNLKNDLDLIKAKPLIERAYNEI